MLEMEVLKGNDLRDIRNHPVIRDMDTFVDTGTVRNGARDLGVQGCSMRLA